MSIIVDGYNVDQIEAPKYLSHGEWELTGSARVEAYWPLMAVSGLYTETWGTSGYYNTTQFCQVYDDPSGISGCIGVSIRTQEPTGALDTTVNQNLLQRKFAVMHEGHVPMLYQSGTLDGAPVLMFYGYKIAPCISGFRAYEHLNIAAVSGMDGTQVVSMTTGYKQCELGWWADIQSIMTGYRYLVKINPHFASAQTKVT